MQFPYRIIFIIGIGLNALAYILALKEKEEEFIYPYGHNKINSEDFSNNLGNKVEVSSLENNDVIINNNKK